MRVRKPAMGTHISLWRLLTLGGDCVNKTDMVVRPSTVKDYEAHIHQDSSTQTLNVARVRHVKDVIFQTLQHMWNVHTL